MSYENIAISNKPTVTYLAISTPLLNSIRWTRC